MRDLIFILMICLFTACEKDGFIGTDAPNGYHSGTVLDYMQNDTANFSLLVRAIKHAGLEHIFDGSKYEQITLFAVDNLSITKFMLETIDEEWNPLYKKIEDIPVDVCREMILSHVIPHRYKRTDVDFEIKGTLKGGTLCTTLMDTDIRVFRREVLLNKIKGAALYIQASDNGEVIYVSSTDLETDNGIIHTLSHKYTWSVL